MNNDKVPAIARPLILTMNFTDESLMLNEGILDALGRPNQVQIMFNKELKRIMIRPCEMDSQQAVVMPTGHVLQVEVGGRSLLKNIRKIAGWKTERGRICIGEPIPEYHAVCFELDNAIAVTADPAPDNDPAGEESTNPARSIGNENCSDGTFAEQGKA